MPTPPMKSVTDLRAKIEGFASRHAALRISEGASPRSLLDCFRRMQQATEQGDHRRFAASDRALHQTIVELAEVPGLAPAWRAAFRTQQAFRMQTLRACWPDLSVLCEAHRALVDAVAAGTPDAAEEEAIAHLDAVWYRLADAIESRSLAQEHVSRACAWLAFHFHEPVRLEKLAAEIAGCSAGHLARLFREVTGLSFSDYLVDLRMQSAARLLRRTRLPIAQIAARVGYRDASRFATHFRRQFAQTPGTFRRRQQRRAATMRPQ